MLGNHVEPFIFKYSARGNSCWLSHYCFSSSFHRGRHPAKAKGQRVSDVFACTGCGKCCTGSPGFVFVTFEEIEKMAAKIGLAAETFARLYIRIIDGRFSLKELLPHYDCIFYKDKKCSVYDVRPQQCQTYPFWPRHMESQTAWDNVKKECEGIKRESRLPICHS